jgi:GTPase SAR1 family protein
MATNYDFACLNDKDFEVLVADLLSCEHNTRFERFKAGRDGGIDGRYFTATGEQVIFQCKHWAKTGFTALLRSLKNTEYDKVVLLNPKRYIIATTLPLSHTEKSAIRTIFGKFMQNDSDVLGCEDINDLLRKHPQVEKAHFKLWLHSTEILSTFTNAAILGRSAFTLHEIRERSSAYVQTATHVLAREKVNNLGVLLITGEPGIGKTTLAEQLCLEYVVAGYQLCVAVRQIEELESLYQEDSKQIFYFDDFLGSNFLAVLDRHEDTHIVGFIRRVSKDKTKRFILTSRSTVLNRGKSLTDRFRLAKLEKHEFEIEVKSLGEFDKARILHSMMWFSGLPREYLEVIVDKRRYWTIIQHANFNPRLISFITDLSRFEGVPPSDYWGYIEETLQNPVDVWDHVFSSQLTDWSRLTVLLVVFAGGSIEEGRLRSCYESLSSEPLVQNYVGDSDFDMGMRVLVGSVLNRHVETGNVTLTLFNPSVADYVLRKTSNSVLKLTGVMAALLDTRSLDNFQKLRVNGIVEPSVHTEVIRRLCKTNLNHDAIHPESVVCLARLGELAIQHCNVEDGSLPEIHQFVQAVSVLPECSVYLAAIAPILRYELNSQLISDEATARLLDSFDASDLDREELEAVSKIARFLPLDLQSVFSNSLKTAIVEYWQNFLKEEIVERDILGDIFDTENTSFSDRLVQEELGRILDNYDLDFTQADRDEMMEYVDVDDIIYGNIKRSMHDDNDNENDRTYVDRGVSEIDDLFSFDLP